MSSSSSDSEDMAKFAAVAVTGNDIHAAAEKSVQDSRKREIRAAARRAGGGGVLGVGAGSDGDSDGPIGILDAAQLRVAEALKKRLDGALDVGESSDTAASSETAPQGDGDGSDSDAGGVALFKNAPRVTEVPSVQAQKDAIVVAHTNRSRAAVESSSDEEEGARRVAAAAVEGGDLITAAAAAAEKAKSRIVPVDPGSEEEGGKAKQRKRKREKAERATAAAAAVKENGKGEEDAHPKEETRKEKKAKKEKREQKEKKEKRKRNDSD